MEAHTPNKFNNEILAAAIEGFESQKRRLDSQISELRQLMTGEAAAPAKSNKAIAEPAATTKTGRKRRKMSAAGRKRIAEAQRLRWAGIKKQAGQPAKAAKPAKTAAKKTKRKLSPEGRQRIIDATKARWEAIRAAAAKSAK